MASWSSTDQSCSVYTFQFIHLCLSESDPEVAYIYFLIKGIIYAFEYLAQIVLLATIYCIFVYLTRSMGLANSSKSSGAWKAVHTIHFCFCGVLCCLFVALLGLSIDQIVKYVPDPYYLYYYGMSSAYNQLVAAYYILYMLASIEAVALSGYFFAKTKDLRAPKNVGPQSNVYTFHHEVSTLPSLPPNARTVAWIANAASSI